MDSLDWTSRHFFHDGDEYFQAMLKSIREAKHSIWLESYIFEIDAFTKILLEELRKARERGCEVRLLVDGIGSFYWLATLRSLCRQIDIELRIWEPIPRHFTSVRRLLVPVNFRILRILRRLNRRDHRKITLIDQQEAFLGSLNFSQVHCESLMGSKSWRDTGVAVQGPSVKDLKEAFEITWRMTRPGRRRFLKFPDRFKSLYSPQSSKVRLNQGRGHRRYLRRNLLQRIGEARQTILITSAYFLPTRSTLIALRNAARRGVHIAIITPGPSDVPMVKWAAAVASKKLLKWGVRIYEFQGRVLHAKYLIIDGWATVGSANLNHRSFFHDLEVEAIFEDADSLRNLSSQWEQDRLDSTEVTARRLRDRPWYHRILEFFAFRLRYIL